MNVYKRTALLIAASALSFGAAAQSNPNIRGANSGGTNGYNINVGVSQVQGGPHSLDHAGIGVNSYASGLRVDFLGLVAYTTKTDVAHSTGFDIDRNPVDGNTRIHSLAFPITGTPPSHSGLGYFNFVQVNDDDVWFGEWSSDASYSNRQVYYVGDQGTTTDVPTSGTASYTVVGINQGNLLEGSFNASFSGTPTLSGTISRAGLSVSINTIINAANASFSGGALANSAVVGTANGHFFGDDAASLAGIADFGAGSTYNTAFGGIKD